MTGYSTLVRWHRAWLPCAILAGLSSRLLAQEAPSVQPLPGLQDVAVRAETNRGTYKLGDAVLLRVTFRNAWNRPLTLVEGAATAYVRLQVVDASGKQVKRSHWPPPPEAAGSFTLHPGEERVLKNTRGEEWISIEDWGFDLRQPGAYKLRAAPTRVEQKGVAAFNAVPGAELSITIEE